MVSNLVDNAIRYSGSVVRVSVELDHVDLISFIDKEIQDFECTTKTAQ